LISFTGLFLLWFTRKQKTGKILVSVGICLILLLSSGFIANPLLRSLEIKYAPYHVQLSNEVCISDEGYPIGFVIVLAGGHVSDQRLPVTSQLSGNSLVRLIEGVRIYRKCPGSKLVLSGGGVFDTISSAEIMADIARELGVNQDDIITESVSKDTKDEAILIKPIVNNNHFILVTSASHMPRSMAMFRKLGMNPVAAPTSYLSMGRSGLNPTCFFPKTSNLIKSERVFYEYLGVIWAKLRGQV
jgi:uncharacterized SAM-binding protein YcdF (DUF218 family)